jgi:putative hemolysin
MKIIINANDLERLQNIEQPTIFLSNRRSKKKDVKVFEHLLLNHYPKINFLPLDNKNPELIAKNIRKILKNTTAQTPVFAYSLCFTAPTWGDMMHQEQVNEFFKALKDLGLNLVLLYFQEEQGVKNSFLEQVGIRFLKENKDDENNVRIRVSPMIAHEELSKFDKKHEVRRFIQSRLFAMGNTEINEFPNFFSKWLPTPDIKEPEAIIEPIAPSLIETEMKTLNDLHFKVVEQANFDVFIAEAKYIPNVLQEIGRLREITFRAIGEGTNKSLDIDEFDLYYRQLIIWDKVEKRIVGGYRIGLGDHIFNAYGVHGFYVSTLFKIKDGFHGTLQKSLELGRSYIIAEYQRKPQPLFLLWKGILMFLIANPRYRYLFGPVSISRQYSDVSRSVMVAFLKKHYFNSKMANYLEPRKPFKVNSKKVDADILVKTFGKELANLDKFVEFTEEGSARLPVLLRQYIRQNARFIGFNLDPNFSDCLDGFIIGDIDELPKSTIDALQKERISVAI